MQNMLKHIVSDTTHNKVTCALHDYM